MKKKLVVRKQSDGARKAESSKRSRNELAIMRFLRSTGAKPALPEKERALGRRLLAAMAKPSGDSAGERPKGLVEHARKRRPGLLDLLEGARQGRKATEGAESFAALRKMLGLSTADGGSTPDVADVEEETK